MTQAYTSKNLSDSLRVFVRPMLFISLGLHGLLLLIPTADSHKATAPKAEKTVKITQLSPTTKPSTIKQTAKKPAPKPLAVAPKAVRLPIARSVSSQPIIPAIAKPKPLEPIQATPAPAAVASPTPTTSSPTSAPTETTVPAGTEALAPTSTNPLEDFPHFPGAKAGCLDISSCFQTGNPLAKVAVYFEQQLPAKQYEQRLEIDETSRKVYQFSRSGLTQYLSLIEIEGSGTVYVLADAPRTLDELKKAVEVPAELGNVLAQLVPETGAAGVNGEDFADSINATPEDFTQPESFYESLGGVDAEGFEITPTLNSEIYGDLKVVRGQSLEQTLASTVVPTLQENGFTVSANSLGEYGGGALYQIQKGKFTGYLNLVPTKDGSGTIVTIWTSSPM